MQRKLLDSKTSNEALKNNSLYKPSRVIKTYSANLTAAIQLPDSNVLPVTSYLDRFIALLDSFTSSAKSFPPDLECKNIPETMQSLETQKQKVIDDFEYQRVEIITKEVREHAARRVDLFFLLLIAVHGKNFIISKNSTEKQHGKGSKLMGTHACHSSLFPNLLLKSNNTTSFFSNTKQSVLCLSQTHLNESQNMTVELPAVVNAFDAKLEGRYQKSSYTKTFLQLLNEVSANKMDIKDAMDTFYKTMHNFFENFESKYLKTAAIECPRTMKLIWDHQKRGTFRSANPDMKSISDEYILSFLRLKKDEIEKLKNNPKIITEFYKRIQEETFQSIAQLKITRKKAFAK